VKLSVNYLNSLKIINLSKTLAIKIQSAIINLTKENNHLKGKGEQNDKKGNDR
jgi:hypothetical protein